MEKSNVGIKSNVYPCSESPLRDQSFVDAVEDYDRLKKIAQKINDALVPVRIRKDEQKRLLDVGTRCTYANNDPCWGYIKGEGIRCKCIEGHCPNIRECNPEYSKQQRIEWTMTNRVRLQYGDPKKQKKYFLVDLVSDKEQSRYVSDPKSEIEFPFMRDPEQQPEYPKERQPVVIGYEEIYFGDADNQLSPIYGYVDDGEDAGRLVVRQHGSVKERVRENAKKETEISESKGVAVEKEVTTKPPIPKVAKKTALLDESEKIRYEATVKGKLHGSYQLTELTEVLISKFVEDEALDVILSNRAEMAYVSGMFLQSDIPHSVETRHGNKEVCLWAADSENIKAFSKKVLVSTAFIEQGCRLETETAWSELANVSEIFTLVASGRDFFEFEGADKSQRWGCKNLYAATHIVVEKNDLNLSADIESDQRVTLCQNGMTYFVVNEASGEMLGTVTDDFVKSLECLKSLNEISELPSHISGFVLTKDAGDVSIKGIGHMKFDEY